MNHDVGGESVTESRHCCLSSPQDTIYYKWASVKMTLKFHFLWSTLFCTTEGHTARPHRRTLGILKSTMVSIETVMALSCFQTNQLTGHKAFREKRQSCWEKRQSCWEKRQSCREKRANYLSWNIGSTHIKSIFIYVSIEYAL